jgi:hypothetical protein
MLIYVVRKLEYEPAAWSFGYCPSCRTFGVLRLETEFLAYYLNGLFRVSREEQGRIARCDFCERRVEETWDWDGVGLQDYSPIEGVPVLLDKLRRPPPPVSNPPSPDVRLHSLLSAIQKRTSAHGQQLGPVGLVVGAVVGALLGIPVGIWLFDREIVIPSRVRHCVVPARRSRGDDSRRFRRVPDSS